MANRNSAHICVPKWSRLRGFTVYLYLGRWHERYTDSGSPLITAELLCLLFIPVTLLADTDLSDQSTVCLLQYAQWIWYKLRIIIIFPFHSSAMSSQMQTQRSPRIFSPSLPKSTTSYCLPRGSQHLLNSKNQVLTGGWSLVKESNMERRDPVEIWRSGAIHQISHIKRSLQAVAVDLSELEDDIRVLSSSRPTSVVRPRSALGYQNWSRVKFRTSHPQTLQFSKYNLPKTPLPLTPVYNHF